MIYTYEINMMIKVRKLREKYPISWRRFSGLPNRMTLEIATFRMRVQQSSSGHFVLRKKTNFWNSLHILHVMYVCVYACTYVYIYIMYVCSIMYLCICVHTLTFHFASVLKSCSSLLPLSFTRPVTFGFLWTRLQWVTHFSKYYSRYTVLWPYNEP